MPAQDVRIHMEASGGFCVRVPSHALRNFELSAVGEVVCDSGVWQRFGTKWAIWLFERSAALQKAANCGPSDAQSPRDLGFRELFLAIEPFDLSGFLGCRLGSAEGGSLGAGL